MKRIAIFLGVILTAYCLAQLPKPGSGGGGSGGGNADTATALAANGANCSAGQFPLGVDASGAAETCTALPTTIAGTANQITASGSTGAITLSIPTNPTLPGTTTATISGNASTATALAANGANCSAGQYPLGVNASGAAESCTSAGNVNTYGTYASLPATCTTGDGYRTSDSIYTFQCTATNTWTAFYDGVTVTIPPSSGWTAVNSASVDASKGYIKLTVAGQSSDNLRVYSRSAPSTPYTITALVLCDIAGANVAQCGIGWYDGTKLATAGFGYSSAYLFQVLPWNTVSSGAAAYISVGGPPQKLWIQISDDGSSARVTKLSSNGKDFNSMHTTTHTNFLTPDRNILFANTNNASAYGAVVHLVSWLAQ